MDSIVRLLPNVLGNPDSLVEESHNEEGSERIVLNIQGPAEFVTEEEINGTYWYLISGNHKSMQEWRKDNSN
jgi:tRNA G37 N-methylase TrmD